MLFDSLDAVREFAGQEYELAVVPPGRGQSYPISMSVRSITGSLNNGAQYRGIAFPEMNFKG